MMGTAIDRDVSVPEKLAAWPDKLRSGEYQQTEGYLKYGSSYCCLGVVDEIVYNPDWTQVEEGYFVDDNGACALINYNAAEELGLSKFITEDEAKFINDYFKGAQLEEMPDFGTSDKRQNTLSALNDRGATFEQIADVIEALNWHKVDEGQGAI